MTQKQVHQFERIDENIIVSELDTAVDDSEWWLLQSADVAGDADIIEDVCNWMDHKTMMVRVSTLLTKPQEPGALAIVLLPHSLTEEQVNEWDFARNRLKNLWPRLVMIGDADAIAMLGNARHIKDFASTNIKEFVLHQFSEIDVQGELEALSVTSGISDSEFVRAVESGEKAIDSEASYRLALLGRDDLLRRNG